MVGRTPEYLGKKVEAREMKLAMLALLIHPLMILVRPACSPPPTGARRPRTIPAPHGFSEILYEFTSASANNGSGFEGLADTYGFNDNDDARPRTAPHWDIACGLVMLISRFIPIIAPLALAGEPGGQEADAVHRRHAAHRHRHLRLRPAGHDPAGRAPCCSCRRRCWARWPSTWGRCRSADESQLAVELVPDSDSERRSNGDDHGHACTPFTMPDRRPVPSPEELKLARRHSRRHGLFAPELAARRR